MRHTHHTDKTLLFRYYSKREEKRGNGEEEEKRSVELTRPSERLKDSGEQSADEPTRGKSMTIRGEKEKRRDMNKKISANNITPEPCYASDSVGLYFITVLL